MLESDTVNSLGIPQVNTVVGEEEREFCLFERMRQLCDGDVELSINISIDH